MFDCLFVAEAEAEAVLLDEGGKCARGVFWVFIAHWVQSSFWSSAFIDLSVCTHAEVLFTWWCYSKSPHSVWEGSNSRPCHDLLPGTSYLYFGRFIYFYRPPRRPQCGVFYSNQNWYNVPIAWDAYLLGEQGMADLLGPTTQTCTEIICRYFLVASESRMWVSILPQAFFSEALFSIDIFCLCPLK